MGKWNRRIRERRNRIRDRILSWSTRTGKNSSCCNWKPALTAAAACTDKNHRREEFGKEYGDKHRREEKRVEKESQKGVLFCCFLPAKRKKMDVSQVKRKQFKCSGRRGEKTQQQQQQHRWQLHRGKWDEEKRGKSGNWQDDFRWKSSTTTTCSHNSSNQRYISILAANFTTLTLTKSSTEC